MYDDSLLHTVKDEFGTEIVPVAVENEPSTTSNKRVRSGINTHPLEDDICEVWRRMYDQ